MANGYAQISSDPTMGEIKKVEARIGKIADVDVRKALLERLEGIKLAYNKNPQAARDRLEGFELVLVQLEKKRVQSSLPQQPLDLEAFAKNQRRATTDFAAADAKLKAVESEAVKTAKGKLNAEVKGITADFNRMVNYLNPDELATRWDENNEAIGKRITAALSTYVNDPQLKLDSKQREALRGYFLAKIYNDVFDDKKMALNPLMLADVGGVDRNGFVFANLTDEKAVMRVFGEVYALDALVKDLVYQGKGDWNSVRTAIDNSLDGAGKIVLGYLYGTNGEVLDRFASFTGAENYTYKENGKDITYSQNDSVEQKYKFIARWAYDNQPQLANEYSRQQVIAASGNMLSETKQVGGTNISRSTFDFMAVAAFARQCAQNPDAKFVSAMGGIAQKARDSNMAPYSQTMLFSANYGNLFSGTYGLGEQDRQAIFGQVVDSYNTIYARASAANRYEYLSEFTDGIGKIDRKNLLDTLKAQLVSQDADGSFGIREPTSRLYQAPRINADFSTRQIAESFLRIDPYANMYYNLDAMTKFAVVFPGNWDNVAGYNASPFLQPQYSETLWRMGVLEIANSALLAIGNENSKMEKSRALDASGTLTGEKFKDIRSAGAGTIGYSDIGGTHARLNFNQTQNVERDAYLRPTSDVTNTTWGAEFAGTLAASETGLLTGLLQANQTAGTKAKNTEYDPVDYTKIVNKSDEEVTNRALLAELNRASANGSNLAIRVDATQSGTKNAQGNKKGEKVDADVFYYSENSWYRSNTRYRIDKETADRFMHMYNEYYQGFGSSSVLVGYENGSTKVKDSKANGFLAGFSIGNFGTLAARTKAGNAGVMTGKQEMEGQNVKAATYFEWFDNTRAEEAGGRGKKGVSYDRLVTGEDGSRTTAVAGKDLFGAQYITNPAGVALSYSFNPVSGMYGTQSDFGFSSGKLNGAGYIQAATENRKSTLERAGAGVEIPLGNGYYLNIEGSVDNVALQNASLGKSPDAMKSLDVLKKEIEAEIAKKEYYTEAYAGRRHELLRDWAARLADISSEYAKMGMADVLTGNVPLLAAATLVKKNEVTGEVVYSIGAKYTSNLPEAGLWEPIQQRPSAAKPKKEELVGLVANFNVTNKLSIFGMLPVNKVSPSQIGSAPSRIVEFAGAKYKVSEDWTVIAAGANFNQPKGTQKPIELDATYQGTLGGKEFKFGMALRGFDEKTRSATLVMWRGDADSSTQVTLSNVTGDDLKELGGSIEKRWDVYNVVSLAMQQAKAFGNTRMDKYTAGVQLENNILPGLRLSSADSQYFKFSLSRKYFWGPASRGGDWEITVGLGTTF